MSENNSGGSPVAGVVLGVVCIFLGLISPILGIIAGIFGLSLSGKGAAENPGMATAAKVLSILGLVVSVGNWVLGTMMFMNM